MIDPDSIRQTKGISILLVDDHPVVRQGYRRVLENQSDFRVVAEADNAVNAYLAFKTHAPDIVVMDISMPGASGLEAPAPSPGSRTSRATRAL